MDAHSKNQFHKSINGLNIIADYLLNVQDMLKEEFETETLDQTFQTSGLDKLIPPYVPTQDMPRPQDNPRYKNIAYISSVFQAHVDGIAVYHAAPEHLVSPMTLTRFIYEQAPILQSMDEKYHMVDIVKKMEMADTVRAVVTAPITPQPLAKLAY